LAAAQAEIQAGAFEVARDLLALAESGPLSEVERAGVDPARAQLAFLTSRGGDAPALLLKAARRLEPIDADRSRATYLDAVNAALFAGPLAGSGGDVLEVARAASAAPPPCNAPRPPDLLLDGTAAGLHLGYAAGVPVLRSGLADFGADMSAEEELRWSWLASMTAMRLWEYDRWAQLSARYVQLARATGALSELPLALTVCAFTLLFSGDLNAAAALIDELEAVKEATGGGLAPYGRLTEMASASGTDWVLGAQARSHALLSEGEAAERLYRESIGRFGTTRLRVDLARAHLLYGEWLRRERRRSEAREQLRTAHGMLEAMGVAAFAERAGRELRATGETARKRTLAARNEELTAQEMQIARLARDGLANPEIGARLFLSAHTVQYHLRKIFPKLGITSRSQLDRVLPGGPAPVQRSR
jgi:DNA-binding CsgD family transcriptional regulator